jgi:putative transposase
MPRRKQPAIPDELLDQLLAGTDPRAALADGGLLDGLKKALAERALNAEMDHHLDGGEPDGRANSRNGYGGKTVLTGTGKLDLQVPRDRLSTFDPQLIAKYQRRFPGFDDRIVSMYARGMSTREIQGHLRELYGIEVSPDLVSAVTDAVLDEVAEWQNRPLEPLYPLVFLDALRVKVRDGEQERRRRRRSPRSHGAQQGRLRRPRRPHRRHQRSARALDRTDRGGQVLAAGHE